MWDLSLLYGIATVSWYAELAFRRRVSMSAIGSVMVMFGLGPLSPWFPLSDLRRSQLPAALGDAGKLAGVGHHPEAHAAQSEFPVHRMRAAASLAPSVSAHLEPGLARSLLYQGFLRHCQDSLNGKPR